MCYLEDIYHSRCGHWTDEPRVYYKCAAASVPGYTKQCWSRHTTGSAAEDSICRKCQPSVEKKAVPKGTWCSVSQDECGKMIVIVRSEARTSNGHSLFRRPSGSNNLRDGDQEE